MVGALLIVVIYAKKLQCIVQQTYHVQSPATVRMLVVDQRFKLLPRRMLIFRVLQLVTVKAIWNCLYIVELVPVHCNANLKHLKAAKTRKEYQ